jgi:hypothetical protein
MPAEAGHQLVPVVQGSQAVRSRVRAVRSPAARPRSFCGTAPARYQVPGVVRAPATSHQPCPLDQAVGLTSAARASRVIAPETSADLDNRAIGPATLAGLAVLVIDRQTLADLAVLGIGQPTSAGLADLVIGRQTSADLADLGIGRPTLADPADLVTAPAT